MATTVLLIVRLGVFSNQLIEVCFNFFPRRRIVLLAVGHHGIFGFSRAWLFERYGHTRKGILTLLSRGLHKEVMRRQVDNVTFPYRWL